MKRINENLEKNIVNDYLNNISTMAITRKYNISRSTVQKYLIKNNIKFHKRMTSKIFNHNFFSDYTKESCYWAGFILADGYLRKKTNGLEILLHKKDSEHLLNFTKLLGFREDIRKFYKIGCSISICSNKIKEDLENNFEIFNNKSLTCYISEKIPKELVSHFIRGYFDGDGTFNCENRFQFLGTFKTCDYIRNFFKENGIVKQNGETPKITLRKNKHDLYYVKYSKNLSKKIYEILFENSYDKIRLKRKYDKINEYLKTL